MESLYDVWVVEGELFAPNECLQFIEGWLCIREIKGNVENWQIAKNDLQIESAIAKSASHNFTTLIKVFLYL